MVTYRNKTEAGSAKTSATHRVGVAELETMVARIFVSAGCSSDEASAIARGLVDSDCCGHASHGVVRVTRYLQWMREGKLKINQAPTVLLETPVLAMLDGNRGFGQVLAPAAVDLGVAKAKENGIGLIALRQSGHLGRIGDWAERAAREGIISIHFVNVRGHPLVAPFGSHERRMSTAPIAMGIPAGQGADIILDFATALVAEGKVLVAAKSGREIDGQPLVDAQGCPSGDPTVLYGMITGDGPLLPSNGKGAIRAFGRHKGSGLALMCEILAGVLTGSGNTKGDKHVGDVWSGMLSLFIDAGHLNENFCAELREYIAYFTNARPSEEGGAVLVPGDPERHRREEAIRNGIELPIGVWQDLQEAAGQVGRPPAG